MNIEIEYILQKMVVDLSEAMRKMIPNDEMREVNFDRISEGSGDLLSSQQLYMIYHGMLKFKDSKFADIDQQQIAALLNQLQRPMLKDETMEEGEA